MKANIWRITEYRGHNDYDGSADDNTKLDIIFDSHFKKEDVEDILAYYWDKVYCSVAIKAELLEEPKQATIGLHLGHQYYCSNCGKLTYMHNYCANCGAKVIKE